MKKSMYSLLMLAVMFMVASCGSKSNSGEATAETEDKEVTFTDPAITFGDGLDLTSYFSAESLTKPGVMQDNNGAYRLSTNVKLKVLKKLNLKVTGGLSDASIVFIIKYCDENGSTIDLDRHYKYLKRDNINNWSEGTVFTIDAWSDGKDIEYNAKQKADKVKKIAVSISTDHLEFAETAESKE